MSLEDKSQDKTTSKIFGEIFKAFGTAISEISDDPELKKKAKEFGESAVESAKAVGINYKHNNDLVD